MKKIKSDLIDISDSLKNCPSGKLISTSNGSYTKWYINIDGTTTYIPKSQRTLAEKLAYKKYLLFRKKELESEIKSTESFLKNHSRKIQKSQQMLNDPAYSSLLNPSIQSNATSEWSEQEYIKNTSYPENLIHKCVSGNIVRSKSEALIDLALFQHNIPYRYECGLTLNGRLIFPDFTILNTRKNKIMYYEHFGMMDNPSYAAEASRKLNLYITNGIIPTIDLVTTFETKDCPLTYADIEEVIDKYFI